MIKIQKYHSSGSLISYDEYAQTYKASWQGCNVVVKKYDIWNDRPVMEGLKREAKVYQVLQSLQGQYIPRLRIARIADGMEMVFATAFVGTNLVQNVCVILTRKKYGRH